MLGQDKIGREKDRVRERWRMKSDEEMDVEVNKWYMYGTKCIHQITTILVFSVKIPSYQIQ